MTTQSTNEGSPTAGDRASEAPTDDRAARSNIEVLILTFNEEINLPHSLRSVVEWADTVYVVDSESTDRTREIAEEMGAKVVLQPWLGYARQKNHALESLPWKSDWIFILDADEVITPELRDELIEIANRPTDAVPEAGFYVNRLTYFMGKAIRHCGFFPSYNLRFFRTGRAHYEDRQVHEHMMVDGETARLAHIMLHDDRRGLEHYIAKHNRYSTLEASEIVKRELSTNSDTVTELERGIAFRRWLKYNILPRLPFAALWRFVYMYFLRLGFLDGASGLRFCLFISCYDFFISLKLKELRETRERATQMRADLPVAKPAPGSDEPARAPLDLEPVQVEPIARTRMPRAKKAARKKTAHKQGTRSPAPRQELRPFGSADAAICPAPPVSVVVLAFNEEENIRACLESCAWCDDVHVLDSGSTDRTQEIARELGATMHVNGFESFGQQRNWAIDEIECAHRWHFHLDADEQFTPALVRELGELVPPEGEEQAEAIACFRCPSMMMFMQSWLRYAADYPVYQVRLFDSRRARFEDYGHGQREVTDGEIGTLMMPYLHHNFSKGLNDWFAKHNGYSSLEARQSMEEPKISIFSAIRGLFGGDSVSRRRHLKALAYKIPARSTAMMFYTVVFRRGFLDGKAGYNYARMRAIYEAMIAVKASVLRDAQNRRMADQQTKDGA